MCLSYFSDHLGIDDLFGILSAIWEAQIKWYNIGLGLKISPLKLDGIERKRKKDPGECLIAMLKIWLMKKDTDPTLQKMVESLRSPIVGHARLAYNLPSTFQELRRRKSQLAPSTSPKSEHHFPRGSLASSSPTSVTTALQQQSSQPRSVYQGKFLMNMFYIFYHQNEIMQSNLSIVRHFTSCIIIIIIVITVNVEILAVHLIWRFGDLAIEQKIAKLNVPPIFWRMCTTSLRQDMRPPN